ncbi:hypothetical protein DSM100688_0402 [Bifidobacterium ramosum]|uniref:Uncharacterized protein n=1 Tax=Bifidobacterium ramosum TaxID=1798158 RepID=A0A6L4X3Q1_9BIFI|nr:hypothetical protein [Bifidobacterium ramosum]KAB8289322.1 hypothetical protein DSM100688_0402 [Bifidobacterium ramosum]
MELKDWLQLITSWIAIGVTIWVELRKDGNPKKGTKRKRRKK